MKDNSKWERFKPFPFLIVYYICNQQLNLLGGFNNMNQNNPLVFNTLIIRGKDEEVIERILGQFFLTSDTGIDLESPISGFMRDTTINFNSLCYSSSEMVAPYQPSDYNELMIWRAQHWGTILNAIPGDTTLLENGKVIVTNFYTLFTPATLAVQEFIKISNKFCQSYFDCYDENLIQVEYLYTNNLSAPYVY